MKPAKSISSRQSCHHCGLPCSQGTWELDDQGFCCAGCRAVFELLRDNGLTSYYDLETTPGITFKDKGHKEQYEFLDDDPVRSRILSFTDGKTARVTFQLPAMHCVACIWLLENLFMLNAAIKNAQVNFPRKEVTIMFLEKDLNLSSLASLLASLGYEPSLKLDALKPKAGTSSQRKLLLKLGIAGFAFGNIMLFSLPVYFGLDAKWGPSFQRFFGLTSFLLCLPVLLYSASDYWKTAWVSIRQRVITLDIPISLGIAALFLQSSYQVLTQQGDGYFDSLAGLVFFLLCGRWFQDKTYSRLSFDRDFESYFPLSITRIDERGEHPVPVTQLQPGDRIRVRNQELIPADAKLISPSAFLDYSFVTGESEPVEVQRDALMYAGGRQTGASIECEIVKPVSQSYLTSLWNHTAFAKQESADLENLTNRMSRHFTLVVIALALFTGICWLALDSSRAVEVFAAVLIVACPCALALSTPFTFGSAMRVLGRCGFYLKNGAVLETLNHVTSVVFDKTGTLSEATKHNVTFSGKPLSPIEHEELASLVRHSTHPLSVSLKNALLTSPDFHPKPAENFIEYPGQGAEALIGNKFYQIGSQNWLLSQGIAAPLHSEGSVVHVAIDSSYRGAFIYTPLYRSSSEELVKTISAHFSTALLSGDHDREIEKLQQWFGQEAELRFEQSPHDKLKFIQHKQKVGDRVLMLGDGLNDAGALKQSDVGIALSDQAAAFTPACDAILDASAIHQLPAFLKYSRSSVKIVQISYLISFIYNAVGITFAAQGLLSPVVCAILMPLSSVSVVAFAVGATTWQGRTLEKIKHERNFYTINS